MADSKAMTRTVEHIYVSTYCMHGLHNDGCKLRCKICEAKCRCACHSEVDVTDDG